MSAPKDSKRATSGKKSTAGKAVVRSKAAPRKPEPTHHRFDIAGILLIALAVFCIVVLISKETGLLGGALREGLLNLFGRGSWVIPIGLTSLGITYFRGSRKANQWIPTIGTILLCLSILGFFAIARSRDFFNPSMITTGGGYVGAIVAAGCTQLLGSTGTIITLVTGSLIGTVCLLDRPLRSIIEDWKLRDELPPAQDADELSTSKRKKHQISPEEDTVRKKSLPLGFADDPDDEPEIEDEKSVKEKRMAKMQEFADRANQRLTASSAKKDEPEIHIESVAPKEGYQLPMLSVLNDAVEKPKRTAQEMQKNIETIEGTLEQFGIDANVVEVATGPTITRYEIQLGPGIRVARIVSLADNIAMDMAASQVRVEAPIPGKAAIGLEIPNVKSSTVNIRELVESKEFLDHPSRLFVALGKDVGGENRYADLTKMPHLLIAGATNSGKSIGLATLITSLLMRNTPKELRLVMIDPKRVELTLFDQIPHLLCPVIKDVKEAPGVLRAVWREMDRRYDLLSEKGVRNIDGWNAKCEPEDKMPYIVVIIDELADLMIQAKAEVETSIVRLAQLARAVGIHLVIATQRPSVDVITGTIKANIPSRVAFAVASQIDSRTILDSKGADSLIGRGDMLFMPIDATKPLRIQGCYVSENEIEKICNHWRSQESPNYAFDPSEFEAADPVKASGDFGDEVDPMWEEVVRYAVETGQVSTSMVQRKFRLGFQRASRLIDQMEARAIVGPKDGARPREVLIGLAELETILNGTGGDYEMGTFIDDM